MGQLPWQGCPHDVQLPAMRNWTTLVYVFWLILGTLLIEVQNSKPYLEYGAYLSPLLSFYLLMGLKFQAVVVSSDAGLTSGGH